MTLGRAMGPAFLGCVICLAGGAAQQPHEPPTAATGRFGNPTGTARTLQGYVYGVVKKIGKGDLVLDKTAFGDAQTFKLEPKTKYVHGGKPSKLADLKVGDMVYVDAKKDKKTGEMTARRVVTGVNPASVQ
jgi:hypothetical protein